MNYAEHIPIKFWAEDDKPREKLLRQGRRSLSDAELLAILINTGSNLETSVELARRILGSQQNDLDCLAQLTLRDLAKFKGIGKVKAAAIMAALELGRRRRSGEKRDITTIADSRDTYNLMSRYFSDLVHEEFRIVLLGRAGKLISHHLISTGGQSQTTADPKIIFGLALDNNASSVILMHNHPSGNPGPSKADLALTGRLSEAGRLLDILVIDHLIFVNNGYFSFADEGIM